GGRRITLGALQIMPQLALGSLPRLRGNERRHGDGKPLTRGPLGPTVRIARDAVFAAAGAIGLANLRRLGPVVIRFALIEGVAEDLANTTRRPTPVARLAGTDALGGEPLMDGIAAELLFDTPAIDQAHDFCFSFINDEMLRGSQGFPDIRVSIGGIAPVDAPLAGSKQPPTSGAL